ncbi:50S ribosomal protein L11 methyltransferase [Desulfosarcina alkanivorans]|uniref:Ribosomal protein L11 methyltransferase n=1 Tax=Desulfosarcina alkanivorans TaxID=571177 RepID=A0A5K7Z0C0_9BACT|nr:50S ribosomal protein L11 methyltransferase [Desulfosarcina alkanivorans]BBO70277.1 50S ribosomal protein L11 methyltransferase [Desulfosarcina alkanivorans]
MKWIAAKVTFDSPDRMLATDLIADVFYTLNLKGVVVDDPDMDPEQDWGEDALRPPETPAVTGYFADSPDAAESCRVLERALGRLERTAGITARVEYTRIDEQDWAEAWKEYFWPEKITATIVVKPSWREYAAEPGDLILEIDPGMAFGTGTHPTTALCIRMIQSHLKPGDAFLDVGTGSGILMIAAAKLGAGKVCGVDNDEVAVTVAGKNLAANHIPHFSLSAGNLVDGQDQRFDLVTANILAEVILELLPDVAAVLSPQGRFICSGIITAKKETVLSGLHERGFEEIEVLEKEGWVAIAARQTDDCRQRSADG